MRNLSLIAVLPILLTGCYGGGSYLTLGPTWIPNPADNNNFDHAVGLAGSVGVAASPVPGLRQLRLGGQVFGHFSLGEGQFSTGGGSTTLDGDVQLWGVTPEVDVSWYQPLGADRGGGRWVLEPGVGIGAYYQEARAEDLPNSSSITFGESEESDWATSVRPFLRVLFELPELADEDGAFQIGVEGSWFFTDSNLPNNVGTDLERVYIGVFIGWRM